MLLDTDENELLTLWLADQVYALVRHEDIATQALNFVIEEMAKLNNEL
jgi:hypothetical protein